MTERELFAALGVDYEAALYERLDANPIESERASVLPSTVHGYSVQCSIRIPDARWTAVSRLPGVFVSGDTP